MKMMMDPSFRSGSPPCWFGKAAAQGLGRDVRKLVDALSKHSTHANKEMRLHVAMERPDTWVVSNEPDGNPAIRKDSNRVAEWWIHKIVSFGRMSWIENSFSIPKHPEVVSMEMPGMDLTVVGYQGVGVLDHNVYHFPQLGDIDTISQTCMCGVGIWSCKDVKVLVVGVLRRSSWWWSLIEGTPELELESCKERSCRWDLRDVVHSPSGISIDDVLGHQEDDQFV